MPGDGWRMFRRSGTVQAERLQEAFVWNTEGGDRLSGRAGDWRVSDGEKSWTVGHEQFCTSYEPAGAGLYRRVGIVRARPGRSGEIVQTLEGPARVHSGDWVVQGGSGECWPVPADRFAKSYAEVGDNGDEPSSS